MASIVYTGILVISFLFLIKKQEEAESYFRLKLIGYFILGSFAFHFNQFSLPLGFILYLLLFRPKLNGQTKKLAAILGVVAFIIVHWIIPYAVHAWESRPVFIDHELGSVYTTSFQDEYELVKQELTLENHNLRLENFEVDYVQDGSITSLSWQLIVQNGSSYDLYQIQYEVGKSRYRVMDSQTETWLQYNRLVDADRFFENLKVLDIEQLTHEKGDFSSYVIRSTGEIVNYAVKNTTQYIVTNGEIEKLNAEKLPVECYYVSTFAMEKTGEQRDEQGNLTQETYEGTEASDYLFDVNFSLSETD